MEEYKIPEEYYFRLHHVRPRFKGDIENVLIYVAEEISRVGEKQIDEFVEEVPKAKSTQTVRGMLAKYADPSLREQEKSAWEKAVVEKYGNA